MLVDDENFDIDLTKLDVDEKDDPEGRLISNFIYKKEFDNLKR
jgi:hypothetical protein